MMKKLLLVLFLVFGPCSLASAETIRLSYANFPPANTFPSVQMERWKEEVELRTNGRVKIDTYPGGSLLGARNMFRGVIQGQADIGNLSMSYQPGVFPMTSVLELPVGFTSAKAASAALWDLYEKYQPREFDQVKVLTMFTSAPSNLMTRQPVRSLDEFRGLEIRASGTASRILDSLGAVSVSMPMPETPEALQRGMVKGLFSSLEVLMDFNFAAYTPYQTMLNSQVYPFAVVMNRNKWNSLPREVQIVLEELGREQALWTGEYMDAHVDKAIEYARENYDAQSFELTPDEYALIEERVRPIIDDWIKEAERNGLPAREILADLESLRDYYESEFSSP
ncbi:TRAP transporter substrate-binding protein [Desulfonatronovibrio hydrogenovorans]|uniref:TRAP transporter substrate-binding protein n=1 Tax=Desulfonatronovibrio hydrogenovorans TaxID=53245 RepID=UPI00048A7748|nr:TRAP transporter substrate-binding protein [Desulfonatronovibrio hydrogenovorans]